METLTSIILAAGAGTRMKSDQAKVTHEAAGRTLLEWVFAAADSAGVTRHLVVVGHHAEEVLPLLPDTATSVMQEERLGTGHALRIAFEAIEDLQGTILVLCGDTPLLRGETLRSAWEAHCFGKHDATVLTAELDHPDGYGRIIRNATGGVTGIVEHRDATSEQRTIQEINTGVFLFEADALRKALPFLRCDNSQGEYYLTDILSILSEMGKSVGACLSSDPEETLGINDRVQLAHAERILLARIRETHMRAGVTFKLPETSYIEADVELGVNTVILPGTMLERGTRAGEGCVIGPYSRIVNSTLADRVCVAQSVVLSSEIGEDTSIGPYAYLRPESKIGKHVKIGDFVEIKKSEVGDGAKISHLTYVGDAIVGKRVNLGCGVVVVNYDGSNKHRTVIEDDAFIGCNTNLVSPVVVREHAYVAAGSTITKEVPAFSLGIARSRQTNLDGWVKRRGLDKPKDS